MRTSTITAVFVALSLHLVSMNGQIPDANPEFNCKSRVIVGLKNGALASCLDTIVIATGVPMQRSGSERYQRAASLVILRWQGDEVVPGDEIPCTVLADPPADNVYIVPDRQLPLLDTDGAPTQFQIEVYCGYWFGEEDTTTTQIQFVLNSRYYATAEARKISDTLLLAGALATPSTQVPPNGYSLDDPFELNAAEEFGEFLFDHWTCSHSSVIINSGLRRQFLNSGCWPLTDTVRFTAWYSDALISRVDDESKWEGADDRIIRWDDGIPESASVELYDLQGRRTSFSYRGSERTSGLYLAVVTRADGSSRIQPLLITN